MDALQLFKLSEEEVLHANHAFRQLAAFGAKRAGGMPIVACFASSPAWVPIVANWHAHVESTGIRSTMVISLDSRTLAAVRGMPRLRQATFAQPIPKLIERGSVWIHRWVAMWKLLEHNLTVLHSDADAIFLRNPLSLLHGITSSIIVSHGQSNAEWLGCMGWLMLRPEPEVRRFVSSLIRKLRRLDAMDDQMNFNRALTYKTGMQWP